MDSTGSQGFRENLLSNALLKCFKEMPGWSYDMTQSLKAGIPAETVGARGKKLLTDSSFLEVNGAFSKKIKDFENTFSEICINLIRWRLFIFS